MEYRVKYRDIPWPVALSVLPGKVIGTFFVKPWLRFKQDWKSILMRRLSNLIFVLIVLLILGLVFALADKVTDGGIQRLINMEGSPQAISETVPPDDAIPTVEEIRELIERNKRNHR